MKCDSLNEIEARILAPFIDAVINIARKHGAALVELVGGESLGIS